MSELKCSHNWEAEWNELRNQMECKEAMHREETDALKIRIAELEKDLMMHEQKWSVIEMIFGK